MKAYVLGLVVALGGCDSAGVLGDGPGRDARVDVPSAAHRDDDAGGIQTDAGEHDAGNEPVGERDAGQEPVHDAGVTPPAPDAGCRGTFCDDFESGTLGAEPRSPWSVSLEPASSSVRVDGTRAHSGLKALKLAVPAGYGGNHAFAELHGAPVFPTPVHEHYGRMWIWFSPVRGASGSFTHVDNIEATGTIDGTSRTTFERVRYGAALYSNDTQLSLYGNLTDDDVIDAAIGPSPEVPISLQQWHCYEWHFTGPTMGGDFWLDGRHIDGLTPPGYQWRSSWQYPMIDSVRLGWQAWGTLPTGVTVWIDDVAVGGSRLGCN